MSEADKDERLNIEVAYAKENEYRILSVQVADGTTVLDAAKQSGMEAFFPEIDWDSAKLGIYGKAVMKPAQQAIQEGQRIEIYRPLIADPKEVRKRRAEQAKQKKELA